MPTKEEWRPVCGFENLYQVSNLGRVRRISPASGTRVNRVLNLTLNHRGYFRCALGTKKIFKTREIHRFVALAFIPNPLNKPQVNHKNGIKTDNRPENLEWVTHQENCQHAQDTGLNPARFSQRQKEAARKTGLSNKGAIPWQHR